MRHPAPGTRPRPRPRVGRVKERSDEPDMAAHPSIKGRNPDGYAALYPSYMEYCMEYAP